MARCHVARYTPRDMSTPRKPVAATATATKSRKPSPATVRDAWVRSIDCPRQRAVALLVPVACQIWGVSLASLSETKVYSAKVAGADDTAATGALARGNAFNRNTFREYARGMCIAVGRALELTFPALVGRENGHTQIREFETLYPTNARLAVEKWHALISGDSELAQMMRTRYEQVLLDARKHVDHAVERGERDAGRRPARVVRAPGRARREAA